jgi:hypothetical protein
MIYCLIIHYPDGSKIKLKGGQKVIAIYANSVTRKKYPAYLSYERWFIVNWVSFFFAKIIIELKGVI